MSMDQCSDEVFISESIRQGSVYTEEEFLNMWKNNKLFPRYQSLRIL